MIKCCMVYCLVWKSWIIWVIGLEGYVGGVGVLQLIKLHMWTMFRFWSCFRACGGAHASFGKSISIHLSLSLSRHFSTEMDPWVHDRGVYLFTLICLWERMGC